MSLLLWSFVSLNTIDFCLEISHLFSRNTWDTIIGRSLYDKFNQASLSKKRMVYIYYRHIALLRYLHSNHAGDFIRRISIHIINQWFTTVANDVYEIVTLYYSHRCLLISYDTDSIHDYRALWYRYLNGKVVIINLFRWHVIAGSIENSFFDLILKKRPSFVLLIWYPMSTHISYTKKAKLNVTNHLSFFSSHS
jgi:hypothetical protein